MPKQTSQDHDADGRRLPSLVRLCVAATVAGAVLGPLGALLALALDIFGAILAFVVAIALGVFIGRACERSTRAWAPVLCVGAGAVLSAILLSEPWKPARGGGVESLGRALGGAYMLCSAIGLFLVCQIEIARKPKRKVAWRLCGQCNYDLRGNTSGRCPECGQLIPDSQLPSLR